MQTYLSFSVGHKTSYFDTKARKQVDREYMNLGFIDSFGFMASSPESTSRRLENRAVSINSKIFHKNSVLMWK